MSFLSNITHGIESFGKGIGNIGEHIGHDITHPKDLMGDLKHLPGNMERGLSTGFGKIGIRGWVGKHPIESIGAAVAVAFGGWAALGAYGAGAGAGGATAAAGSAGAAGAGGSLIPAGTAIGQTVPAIPSVASMTSGTGAAITATPSYTIVAGVSPGGLSLSSGGAAATHLGGEATVSNTGLTSSTSWLDKAKSYYDIYQKVNQFTQQGGNQQDQSSSQWKGVAFQNNPSYQGIDRDDIGAGKSPAIPTTTTQILNGIDINSDINNGPFTKAGTFGGLN
ncbi:hypothetical protein ABL632_003998 [Salmonella enterica subsp. enterica serovar Braenderup]|nr:hypothetical protein [Salmonella enterica]